MLSEKYSKRTMATVVCTGLIGCGLPTASSNPQDAGKHELRISPEACGNGLDDNFDGQVDEGCACALGSSQRCFVGNPSVAGQGRCTWGTQACTGTGEFGVWGPCAGYGTDQMCQQGNGDGNGATVVGTGDGTSGTTGSGSGNPSVIGTGDGTSGTTGSGSGDAGTATTGGTGGAGAGTGSTVGTGDGTVGTGGTGDGTGGMTGTGLGPMPGGSSTPTGVFSSLPGIIRTVIGTGDGTVGTGGTGDGTGGMIGTGHGSTAGGSMPGGMTVAGRGTMAGDSASGGFFPSLPGIVHTVIGTAAGNGDHVGSGESRGIEPMSGTSAPSTAGTGDGSGGSTGSTSSTSSTSSGGSTGSSGGSVPEACAYTQGGWGQAAHGNNVGSIRDAHFSEVYGPNGLTVGCGIHKLRLSSAAAVEALLPTGGMPASLNQDYSDPTSTSAGVFAGQVIALRLNVDFDAHGYLPHAGMIRLAQIRLVSGRCAGMTVADVLTEATLRLGGCTGTSSLSTSDLNECVSGINQTDTFVCQPVQ